MTQQDMLTKEAVKERVLLLSMLNHGTLISMISFNSERTMVKRRTGLEIFSMLSGFPISS